MSTLLYRLRKLHPQLFAFDKPCAHWDFSERLRQQPIEFFYRLMQHRSDLELEYSVLQVRIAQYCGQSIDRSILQSQLEAALVYAELLDTVSYFANQPQASRRFQQEQALYRRYLRKFGVLFYFAEKDGIGYHLFSISEQVRALTARTNWPRLMVVRTKRVLDTLVPLAKNMENFKRLVFYIDFVANPIFAYLAWCFYVPRLAINLFNLLKNTWDDRHPELCWQRKLSYEWSKLWFELCNDSVWMVVGLINCFVLIGALAPAAIYVTVTLYIFDVILSGIRATTELYRLHALSESYQTLLLDSEEHEPCELLQFKPYIDQQIAYEKARMWLSVGSTSALFFGMCFSLPVLALSPIIPVMGACFIVATCLVTHYLSGCIEAIKPQAPLPINEALKQVGFFTNEHWNYSNSVPQLGLLAAGTEAATPICS